MNAHQFRLTPALVVKSLNCRDRQQKKAVIQILAAKGRNPNRPYRFLQSGVLTFDMSSIRQQAKLAVGCPLDRRIGRRFFVERVHWVFPGLEIEYLIQPSVNTNESGHLPNGEKRTIDVRPRAASCLMAQGECLIWHPVDDIDAEDMAG
jgi:hypothetical protein